MPKRAGVTRKVSLSVHKEDLAVLKAAAKRLHGGNLSAVFADLIATIKRREAWAKAEAWYGKPIVMTDEEREVIDRELVDDPPPAPGRTRRRPAA